MIDKGTILVVDDDVFTHELLKAMLASKEYLLVSVLDGRQALKRALEIVPDLIILDVMMPDIDGFEVCRLIRANPVLNEVPIIMLTALDDPNSRTKGIEAGVDDFIPKPYDEIELTSRVQSILRLNRYRRLLAERQKFNWVIEQDSDGYVILDDEDRIEYLNPASRLLLDISTEIDTSSLTFFGYSSIDTPLRTSGSMEPMACDSKFIATLLDQTGHGQCSDPVDQSGGSANGLA